MKKILVIGSINMDYTVYVDSFPLEGETTFGSSRLIQPGGKGENQAVAIAKSGIADLTFFGAIGDDEDGRQIQNVLKEYHVKNSLKVCKGVETGNATIVVDSKSENKIIIIKGANGQIRADDIDLSLIEECDYIVLQNEIPQDVNEFVMKQGHSLGKIIIYNPAPYRPIDSSLFQYIDYLIPNKVEISQITGKEDPIEGAKGLIKLGVKNVLVTLGTKGSILINNKETITAEAYKVKAVDTVAAGDTYIGYFVSSLAAGYSLKQSMEYASKASSITVQRKGSVISIPSGKEVFI